MRAALPAKKKVTDKQLLAATYRFLSISNNISKEIDTLNEFVRAIREVTGCAAAGIRMFNEHKLLIYGAQSGFSTEFLKEEATLSLTEDHCLCTMVFLQKTTPGKPFFTAAGAFHSNDLGDLSQTDDFKGLCPQRGICVKTGFRTMALLPVRARDQVLGIIHIADPEPGRLPLNLLELMEYAAAQLGSAIEKARAREMLERSNEFLESEVKRRTTTLQQAYDRLQIQITQRLSAEIELAHNWHLLQQVFDGIMEPLVLLDEKSNVTMVNTAAQAYYNVDQLTPLTSRPCYEVLRDGDTFCPNCRIPAAVQEGRLLEFERPGLNDPNRLEAVSVYPIKKGEHLQGAIVRIQDITEAREIERKVNALKSKASMGMLVSSVVHEIKNPNSFIAFNISVLREYIEAILPLLDRHAQTDPDFEISHLPYADFRKDVFKLLDTVEHGSRRIDAFLKNLKGAGENGPELKVCLFSLPRLMDNILAMIRRRIETSVKTFHVEVDPHLDEMYSDPGILEQVIVNLLINGIQSMDKGDSYLGLKVKPIEHDPFSVSIVVEDNGSGMDQQMLNRIFEPFYSTKIAEGGTGLGLYVCRNLALALGGRLEVFSEVGLGSRFTLELPLDSRAGCADRRRRPRSRSRTH